MVALDVADLVHGTVAGERHSEVISSSWKSLNSAHKAMNLGIYY